MVFKGIDNERKVYPKRNYSARDVEMINRHLADEREKYIGENQNPGTADDIELDVDEWYVREIRKRFKKH